MKLYKPLIQSGTGIILKRGDKVCISKRTGTSTFDGYWQFPGGRVEDGENVWPDTVTRELREETGLDLPGKRIQYLGKINGTVCSTIFMYLVELQPGEEPQHIETDKSTPWQWVPIEQALRMQLIDGVEKYLKEYVSGQKANA